MIRNPRRRTRPSVLSKRRPFSCGKKPTFEQNNHGLPVDRIESLASHEPAGGLKGARRCIGHESAMREGEGAPAARLLGSGLTT
jgi:hypothetical protein